MPIYEYLCEECGHKLEKIQKFSDDPLTDCPSCCESALRKIVSASAFRLKGGGWYETDFKTGTKRNVVDSGDSSDSKSSSAEKSSSDDKGDSSTGKKQSSGNSKGETKGSSSSTTSSGSGNASSHTKDS